MARDPPSLLSSSSELRDISPTPSSVRSAKITIIHPQLRDLILPLERGRVLYPRGTTVEEQRWLPSADRDNGDGDGDRDDVRLEGDEDEGPSKRGITGSTRPLLNLSFTPNCLTASSTILACGGQHGELYLCNLPQPPTLNPLFQRFTSSASASKIKPFSISTTLPGRSINNSIIIPPSWPDQWAKVSSERKLGYIGRGSRKWEEVESYPRNELIGRVEAGEWVRRTGEPHGPAAAAGNATWAGEGEDDGDPMDIDERDDSEADTELLTEDDDDLDYDLDTTVHSPTSTSSVATYPNTVPFLHAPRIPHLAHPLMTNHHTSASPARRSASFSSSIRPASRNRSERYSFSSSYSSMLETTQPPPQYVTSRYRDHRSRSGRGFTSSSIRPVATSVLPSNGNLSKISRMRKTAAVDEPRILISNNDCTVKVFSLHPVTPSSSGQASVSGRHADTPRDLAPQYLQQATGRRPDSVDRSGISASRPLDRLGLGAPRASSSEQIRPRTTTAFEWAAPTDISRHTHPRLSRTPHLSIGGGIPSIATHANVSSAAAVLTREAEQLQRELDRYSSLRAERDIMLREREEFERIIGMHVGAGTGLEGPDDTREERRLNKVGGTRFKVATNHSSLSPDLKTMVSVGDSTDVNVFEVIDGGREFRKIAVYEAASDAGFSTAWSKDGRKFAVASQDGQVTIWDHRSSRPLAIFHTTATKAVESESTDGPSFTDDVTASRLSSSPSSSMSSGSGWNLVGPDTNNITLRDPITGVPSIGTSTSGREAARVVKFSPEGSSRDLMVFSEENSNIHIIDAQTFHSHLIVPVPHVPSGTADPDALTRPRLGIEGGGWGIAGVAFDPTGDWLYSGTERTVVEWDLRRGGKGQGIWGLV
ncbi:hypothetical protein I316_01828 [Kwoniella heveanensis BCC8398]|uniref:DUF2415 domain-containing protein n=1 Tax=Kwoniella heveanensis BCC8398 TaxID=1296120 RepID=A0A1B9GZZ8_9TREE|nr:hypothetical protein I316_01828 [Kwoniella heveanensis BCC8398]